MIVMMLMSVVATNTFGQDNNNKSFNNHICDAAGNQKKKKNDEGGGEGEPQRVQQRHYCLVIFDISCECDLVLWMACECVHHQRIYLLRIYI